MGPQKRGFQLRLGCILGSSWAPGIRGCLLRKLLESPSCPSPLRKYRDHLFLTFLFGAPGLSIGCLRQVGPVCLCGGILPFSFELLLPPPPPRGRLPKKCSQWAARSVLTLDYSNAPSQRRTSKTRSSPYPKGAPERYN